MFPTFQFVAIGVDRGETHVPEILADTLHACSAAAVSDPASVDGRNSREGFITGQPAVVRESEAAFAPPASGRRRASPLPPPVGVPVSSPRAEQRREGGRDSYRWSSAEARAEIRARLLAVCELEERERAADGCSAAKLEAREADCDARLATADFGGIHAAFRDAIFHRYPQLLRVCLKERYLETAGPACTILFGETRWRAVAEGRGTDSYYQADIELAALDGLLQKPYIRTAFDQNELAARAKRHASACRRIAARGSSAQRAYEACRAYVAGCGLAPPTPNTMGGRQRTVTSCLNRLKCKRWWERSMRRVYCRRAEEALRQLGRVHQGKGLYVSSEALLFRIERRLATFALLDAVTATNDLGESFTLGELSTGHVSNPVVRRVETMVRLRGLVTYAERNGHQAHPYVVTVPSRFHCVTKEGIKNPHYRGASVQEAQAWLNRQWSRLRSFLRRRGVAFYGFRSVEPQHDGTPHWNILIFSLPADGQTIDVAVSKHFPGTIPLTNPAPGLTGCGGSKSTRSRGTLLGTSPNTFPRGLTDYLSVSIWKMVSASVMSSKPP